MVERRQFVASLASGVFFGGALVRAKTVRAKPSARHSIGFPTLVPTGRGQGDDFLDALRQGLAEHGYLEGSNITLELRDAGGVQSELPRVIRELIALRVSVLVLPLSNTVSIAAKLTQTIPIVTTLIGDPVALGFADDPTRPLRNVTGLTVFNAPLTGKRLELLRDAAPDTRRVGLLRNAKYPETTRDLEEARSAAPRFGFELVPLDFGTPQEMLNALEMGVHERIDSLVVVPDFITATYFASIVRFAGEHRLPGVYHHDRFANPSIAPPGGLVAYGPDRGYNFRRAAFYIDRLLRGTRPQDLPFEQPKRFKLALSRRAARMLNLPLPQSLLVRADIVFD